MKTDPVQNFILKSHDNLRIAKAVTEAWPTTRGKLVCGFLDRLDTALRRELRNWKSSHDGATFFIKRYAGYSISKPGWQTKYYINLECAEYGERINFGVSRGTDDARKQPFCPKVLQALQEIHPSAKPHSWWEAYVAMRSPAPDWREPEVLWRMHTDQRFLRDVADQLLEVATVAEPILDERARKK